LTDEQIRDRLVDNKGWKSIAKNKADWDKHDMTIISMLIHKYFE
jgi:hypothetical protein